MNLLRLAFAAVFGVALGILQPVSGQNANPTPPVAHIEPVRFEKFGDVRVDNYYWLNQRDNPDVVAYLEAENEYTNAMTAHTAPLREELFEEIKGRVKQDDATVPFKHGDFYYYKRYVPGKSYPVYCRKHGSLDAPEQVMLDVNELASGQSHMRVKGLEVSPDGNILAYGTDAVGRRFYTIHFKNLVTGEELSDQVADVTGALAWANDNETVFYTKQDPQTLRWDRIYRHHLGSDASSDELVYQEDDIEFDCSVWKTKSEKYVMIGCYQTLSTEFRYLDADHPDGEFAVILPREADHEYYPDHVGDSFYIRTNWQAKNFRLMEAKVGKSADKSKWREVIPHHDDVLLKQFDLFRDYLVVQERKNGLTHLRIHPRAGGNDHYLDFGEPAYVAEFGDNYEIGTPKLRFTYTSLTTPETTYDYDMNTRDKTLLKRETILGDFDPGNYVTERLYATARDGVKVPISIVYRKGFTRDGSAPLLLYGYGSYGYSLEPRFRPAELSLIDRGFAFAIAHVRGGSEMGYQWYEDGKLLHKKNTFTDFIDCGEYLVESGYTNPDKLFAWGRSAGGLLAGAIYNMRPDLFKGVIADVPFVDVMTTMLDETIPLTTSEYDEWGNPNEKIYYDYMRSYSPYDNVEAKDYTNLLVRTGFHDSQVQYFEPAKWVAKLRALKTDDNMVLMKTEMDAGHSGGSGRFREYEEDAFAFGFLLDLAGYKTAGRATP